MLQGLVLHMKLLFNIRNWRKLMKNNEASQKVYDYVYSCIISGQWKSGDKISSENELSKQLDVSRVSVRKALDQLVGSGILIKRQGAGAFVAQIGSLETLEAVMPLVQLNEDELIKLLEFRIGFESSNVELLQKYITPDIVNKLEHCYEMMVNHKNDLESFYIYDYQFHQIIADGTQNPFVIRISQLLTEMIKRHLEKLNKKIGPDIGIEYHKRIIDAIHDEDYIIAARYMKRHMEVTITAVLEEEHKQIL